MNPVELIETNVHRFAREATPADLVRVLRVIADQMRHRDLAGWLPVAQGSSQLHEALHAQAVAEALSRSIRRAGDGPR